MDAPDARMPRQSRHRRHRQPAARRRCPDCGARIDRICLACQARELAEANHRDWREPTEPLGLDLVGEDRQRYEQRRYRPPNDTEEAR